MIHLTWPLSHVKHLDMILWVRLAPMGIIVLGAVGQGQGLGLRGLGTRV